MLTLRGSIRLAEENLPFTRLICLDITPFHLLLTLTQPPTLRLVELNVVLPFCCGVHLDMIS